MQGGLFGARLFAVFIPKSGCKMDTKRLTNGCIEKYNKYTSKIVAKSRVQK